MDGPAELHRGVEWQLDRNWEIPPEKVAALRETLQYLTEIGGYSPQKIQSTLLSFVRDAYVPSHDMISRFIASKAAHRARKPDSYILLTYYIGMIRRENETLFSETRINESIRQFVGYCRKYFEERSTDIKFRDRYILGRSHSRAARSSGTLAELLTVLSSLALPVDSIFGAHRLVFKGNDSDAPPGATLEQRYLAYGYGLKPNSIFKSFVSLSKAGAPDSPVSFQNQTKDRLGRLRLVSGFGLNLGTKLYLLGNIDGGAALEIMAFSHFNASAQLLAGLTMSIGAAAELFVTRIVLKRLKHFPDESEIGHKPYQSLKAEVSDFEEMLANKLDFDLTSPIMLDGQPITQNRMVEEVARLLKIDERHSRFTYADGTEFNPASSNHYTFNAALGEFR